MGRRRKEADLWLPDKVYRGRSAYEYRPIKGVCIRLCALDASKSVVNRRYSDEFDRFHTGKGTVKEIVDAFLGSPQFAKLSVNTRKDYEKYWRQLEKVFGKMDAQKVLPEHIRKYMDIKGKSSEVQANRHHSFLSKVFSWSFERGMVSTNPAKGVKKFAEKSRDRYVTDEEYALVYKHADARIKIVMEISYLCAARQSDVLKLTKSQILNEGILIKQGKTGKKQIKAWTPRLRAAIELSKTLTSKIDSIYVIPNTQGLAYTGDGFRSMFHDVKLAARKESGKKLDFTFHDLKAKGISDYDGDKQKFSGHKTASQVAIYDRKTQVVESLNVPSISEAKKSK